MLRLDRTCISLAQLFFVNIFFISCFWFISLSPSCYVIWLNLVSDYGIFRGCEEMIEFYITVVIMIVLSQVFPTRQQALGTNEHFPLFLSFRDEHCVLSHAPWSISFFSRIACGAHGLVNTNKLACFILVFFRFTRIFQLLWTKYLYCISFSWVPSQCIAEKS